MSTIEMLLQIVKLKKRNKELEQLMYIELMNHRYIEQNFIFELRRISRSAADYMFWKYIPPGFVGIIDDGGRHWYECKPAQSPVH